jgi:hypothetical protein
MSDRSEVRKLYCAVEFVPVVEVLKPVTIEVENLSQTPLLMHVHNIICIVSTYDNAFVISIIYREKQVCRNAVDH